MRERFSGSMTTLTIAGAAVGVVISVSITSAPAQAPVASTTVLTTPWGEPDLQGIWTDETDTPLQRSAKYATQEFFTAAQRAELDAARAALLEEDRRLERRTERDVAGAYNSVFLSMKRVGARTSKIVDPPEGRIPSLTPEAQKIAAAERELTSPCCNRPKRARTGRRPAPAGNTIRPPRRGVRSLLRATTLCTSIATTARRTTGRMTAA